MKTKKSVFFLLLCTGILFSCTSTATTVKENRRVGSFKKISVTSGIDVYFTQENSQNIEVEANQEIINKVITRVDGETLVIEMERGGKSIFSLKNTKNIKMYVSAPAIGKVSISGGSDFYTDKLSCNDSFELSASGGADAHIGQLNVAKSTGISVSGGSDCSIKDLKTSNCNFSSSGGADLDITLEASGNVSVSASGGSDVQLSGQANMVSASASGGSDIDLRKLSFKNITSNKSGGSDIYQ
jgi:hypothetical protein